VIKLSAADATRQARRKDGSSWTCLREPFARATFNRSIEPHLLLHYSISPIQTISMDIQSVVDRLRQEVRSIEAAIAALVGLGQTAPRRGRPPKASQPMEGKKRFTMSKSARARISAAQKARWAKQKGTATPKTATAAKKKSTGRKPMSPAMKKRLSAMMKARWAARRKQ
jgi:hypothetical protein